MERTPTNGRGQARKWNRVSKSEPCCICGRPDFCTVSEDGAVAHCQRVESDKPATGSLGGWIHKTGREPMDVASLPRRKEEVRPVIDWDERAQAMFARCLHGNGWTLLAETLGVSEAAMKRLGVGIGYDDFGDRESFWSFPERNVNLKCTGIVRRYRDGSKKTMKWSRSGLYLVREWWKPEGPILLVEGGSDTAAALTMGLCVIGRPSNRGGVNLLCGALHGHRNRKVIVMAENDAKPEKRGDLKSCPTKCKGCPHCAPGMTGARATAVALATALKMTVQVCFCGDGAKDTRDWLNQQSNRADLGKRYIQSLRAAP